MPMNRTRDSKNGCVQGAFDSETSMVMDAELKVQATSLAMVRARFQWDWQGSKDVWASLRRHTHKRRVMITTTTNAMINYNHGKRDDTQ